jgi:hypothetical protein
MPLIDAHFCPDVASAHAWNNIVLSRDQLRAPNEHPEFPALALTEYHEFIRMVSRRYQILGHGSLVLSPQCIVYLLVCGLIEYQSRWIILVIGVIALLLVLSLPVAMAFILSARMPSPSGARWKRLPVEIFTSSLYSREASEPKDMAFGIWAVLQKKAVGNLLPQITYADGLSHIYWTLATQIIRQTSSIQLLYLAAAKGILGAPSWVPDWSARNGHQWKTVMSSIRQTDLYGRSEVWYSRLNSYRETEVSAYFELDATGKVLTVRGRHVCDVRRLKFMDFQGTEDTFQESERDIHLRNLGLMLQEASVGKRFRIWLSERDKDKRFPFYLLEQAGKNKHDPWFKERAAQISKWSQFCRRHARRSPSDVLALLESENGPTNESTLETQVMISNILAREGRPIFWSSRASSIGGIERLQGICGRNVEIGDLVVRITGLPQLLVLRMIAGDGNAVRIVSPAALDEGSIPKGPSWPWRRGVTSDEETVQYQIY